MQAADTYYSALKRDAGRRPVLHWSQRAATQFRKATADAGVFLAIDDRGRTPESRVYASARRQMVDEQLRRRGIRDERVLQAMLEVPRHEFVPEAVRNRAYEDGPLPIGKTETISQPYIVAAMTEAVRVEPNLKVLEVGAGSGYQAAILAHIGAKVWTLERNPELPGQARERLDRLGYGQVEVVSTDGSKGYPAAAPYDVIMVTAAAPQVPQVLLDQLGSSGRLLIPVGDLHHQDLHLITRKDDGFITRVLDPCQFVPLVGAYGWPEDGEWIQ